MEHVFCLACAGGWTRPVVTGRGERGTGRLRSGRVRAWRSGRRRSLGHGIGRAGSRGRPTVSLADGARPRAHRDEVRRYRRPTTRAAAAGGDRRDRGRRSRRVNSGRSGRAAGATASRTGRRRYRMADRAGHSALLRAPWPAGLAQVGIQAHGRRSTFSGPTRSWKRRSRRSSPASPGLGGPARDNAGRGPRRGRARQDPVAAADSRDGRRAARGLGRAGQRSHAVLTSATASDHGCSPPGRSAPARRPPPVSRLPDAAVHQELPRSQKKRARVWHHPAGSAQSCWTTRQLRHLEASTWTPSRGDDAALPLDQLPTGMRRDSAHAAGQLRRGTIPARPSAARTFHSVKDLTARDGRSSSTPYNQRVRPASTAKTPTELIGETQTVNQLVPAH